MMPLDQKVTSSLGLIETNATIPITSDAMLMLIMHTKKLLLLAKMECLFLTENEFSIDQKDIILIQDTNGE
jgi:hypothetical protein